MKNLIKITFAMALSSMLFFSCSKDETVTKGKEKVKITLSADKDGIASKTAAVEGETSVSYVWTNEDVGNIKLFTVSGSTLTEITNPTIEKVSEKNLTITAEVVPGQTYTFRAILCQPSSYQGTNPKVAANQTPNGTSGFDPNADILVSDDLVVDVAADGSTSANLNLKFHHKVVVNKMTLKNMPVGEKIRKVEITSDLDLTGTLKDGIMEGDGNKITLTYNDVAVPSNGEFPVYFISMANSGQKLKVEVTTDKDVYSKSFTKSIDLILGQFTRFGAKLPKTAKITFGSKSTSTAINGPSVTGLDNKNNTWTILTPGTSAGYDFSQEPDYSLIGNENKPVNSITFTPTLPSSAKVTSISIKLGGIDDTDGKVELKVGGNTIKQGSLNGYSDVTISSTNTNAGAAEIYISFIKEAVKVYEITIVYE